MYAYKLLLMYTAKINTLYSSVENTQNSSQDPSKNKPFELVFWISLLIDSVDEMVEKRNSGFTPISVIVLSRLSGTSCSKYQ